MCMQLTHLFLAYPLFEQLKAQGKSVDECGLFLAGVLFPDIQYIAPVSREQTHLISNEIPKNHFPQLYQDILLDLEKKDFFKAGMKFHAFCDRMRVEVIHVNHIYETLSSAPWIPLKQKLSVLDNCLKFVEDMYAFEKFSIDAYTEMTFCVLYAVQSVSFKQEMLSQFNLDEATLNQWYQVTCEYVANFGPLARQHFCDMLGKENEGKFLNTFIHTLKTSDALDYFENLSISFEQWNQTQFDLPQPLQPFSSGELRV